MRLIFSRKGFDRENGGVPSPILPDGSLCPLPIPGEGPMFREVRFQGKPLSSILQDLDLTKQRLTNCHLDPDLRRESLKRHKGWRPLFGQFDSSQGHLRNEEVGPGDLFIFYGWFRRTVNREERLAYEQGKPDLHVIFGWLQVGEVIPQPTVGNVPSWAAYHPHVRFPHELGKNNTLYISSPELHLPGLRDSMPGGGAFGKLRPALCLTDLEKGNRAIWRLPGWLHPGKDRPPLTYHRNLERWTLDQAGVLLETVRRGQEFVLDCDHYPEAKAWLSSLMATWSARDLRGDRAD